MTELEQKLGYTFKNKRWLQQALTHSSLTGDIHQNYERLEFLGDAVLKLVMSDILYKKFPNSREGKMTNIRSILVSDDFLFNLAEDLDLKRHIRISKSLESCGGRNTGSLIFSLFIRCRRTSIREHCLPANHYLTYIKPGTGAGRKACPCSRLYFWRTEWIFTRYGIP